MGEAAVQQSLEYLQSLSSNNGPVYDSLKQLLAKLLDEKPMDAYVAVDTVLNTSETVFKAKEWLPLVSPMSSASAAKTIATLNLFGLPDLGVDPDTGEPIDADVPNDYECEDVEGDAELFDAIGVGLGRNVMTAVALAVKSLGEDTKRNVATVRFFGKFFGIQGDYYVFETTLKETPEMPEAPEGQVPFEPYGEGSNAYIYYVCSYLGGPVTQLPYVTPPQIKAARLIKHFLTGKLDAQVSSYPPFPGREGNYLRAQIARIAAATVCCPESFFQSDEDSGEVSKNEEFVPRAGRQMSLPVNWSHRYAHLKKQGRCEVFKRDPPEDMEEEEELNEKFYTEEEKEVSPPPLRTLDKDSPMFSTPILAAAAAAAAAAAKAGEVPPPPVPSTVAGAANVLPAWTTLPSSATTSAQGQVGGVRSNVWPGACCASRGTHFTNIYVGWGFKEESYKPVPPPNLAPDFTELPVESNELPPKPAPVEEEEEES